MSQQEQIGSGQKYKTGHPQYGGLSTETVSSYNKSQQDAQFFKFI